MIDHTCLPSEDDEPATGYFVSINENDKDQCPKIRRKRQYQCHGKDQSTCWSPGVPDLDCPYSGLCCFDGCANKCLKSQSYEEEEEEEQPSYEPEQPTYNQVCSLIQVGLLSFHEESLFFLKDREKYKCKL